ncbi:MAG: electron transport complex protein RnfD [Gammaproteobacteria bacterium]|jgi:electron transport complex protein RnfD
MLQVLVALVPGIATYVAFFGPAILVNIVIATVTAVIFEAGMLLLRGVAVKRHLLDLSAVLTAVLLALAIPTSAPAWLIVVGVGFAIIIAKQLYGGLGYNPFNPAMIGYVVLLISFPALMTQWPGTDGLTAATPLDSVRTAVSQKLAISGLNLPIGFGQSPWHWISVAYVIGGIYMLVRGTIRWQIPASILGTLLVMSTLCWMFDSDRYVNPVFHLFSGATMLGAFFIATDPVSASTTERGRIIYGVGIGFFIYIIRSWGGYPDAVAFSVLLMNAAAPTIDYYTKPRVFGYR